MRCKVFVIALIISTVLFSCINKTAQENKSRVAYFEYGGHEDTASDMLHGMVVEEPKNKIAIDIDSLSPLPGVQIFIETGTPGFVKSYSTDAHGEFAIPFQKGTYNFSLKKDGYQPLKVTNYIADPDHAAKTKIILVKEN